MPKIQTYFRQKRYQTILICCLIIGLLPSCISKNKENLSHVKMMMGTGGHGRVVPMAATPFGMVQLGPDNHLYDSGYHYDINSIIGFSHTHKSGGGGTDYLDIMFFPTNKVEMVDTKEFPSGLSSPFSHENEYAEPGYYSVKLDDSQIKVELTATDRCGMHRYTYPKDQPKELVVDLKHGHFLNCTIIPEDNFDTVKVSRIEIIDDRTIRGSRISNGWAKVQHVYFYAEFSKPFSSTQLYKHRIRQDNAKEVEDTDTRAILYFDSDTNTDEIIARVGISPVSMEGAKANLEKEITTWNFDKVREATQDKWSAELNKIEIRDSISPQKEVFYSCLYNALLYPMLYSDVTGEYRGSDTEVHKGDFRYYAGTLAFWDQFRAQQPLINIVRPDVSTDLMKTLYAHYEAYGKLPIWTLAGVETYCMIGYHSLPVIADAYSKGIRGFDAEKLYEAMKTSANIDTVGYFLREMRGAINYKKYNYVPGDLEITAASKTLEYAYDDWCVAQMAKMLGHKEDYKTYIDRAGYYKSLFDKETNFMRGRLSDGSWRTPFSPFESNHYRPGDDFCEGTSWQWSFFVPHDGKGLIDLFGGHEAFATKLDSLFIVSSQIEGDNPAPDITGLIGQYAHGNEPSHSTIYMYNYAGQPWKTQDRINQVLYDFYDTTPTGLCGNDDCGQMSAWYVFSALGFYPVTHGTGVYFIGTPIFQDVSWKHSNGTLTILAKNASKENKYIKSLKVNGKPHNQSWITHEDLFGGNAVLEFEMQNEPNKDWGSDLSTLPPSMADETF